MSPEERDAQRRKLKALLEHYQHLAHSVEGQLERLYGPPEFPDLPAPIVCYQYEDGVIWADPDRHTGGACRKVLKTYTLADEAKTVVSATNLYTNGFTSKWPTVEKADEKASKLKMKRYGINVHYSDGSTELLPR